MVPALPSLPVRTVSRLLGALAALSAGAAAGALLFPAPLADVFFAWWVLVGVGLAVGGAVAAWTGRTPLVWVAALLLAGLSVAGMWSIGPFVAPAALLLLASALLLQWAGPRRDGRAATRGDPPAARAVAVRALAGAGSVAVGAALVYAGAVTRGLFGACARETLACAVDVAHWGAIAATVLGFLAVGVGARLLWRQAAVARTLASRHA